MTLVFNDLKILTWITRSNLDAQVQTIMLMDHCSVSQLFCYVRSGRNTAWEPCVSPGPTFVVTKPPQQPPKGPNINFLLKMHFGGQCLFENWTEKSSPQRHKGRKHQPTPNPSASQCPLYTLFSLTTLSKWQGMTQCHFWLPFWEGLWWKIEYTLNTISFSWLLVCPTGRVNRSTFGSL